MKLTVSKQHIVDGLQKAAGIIPVKAGAAYLRSIWLKADEKTLSVMTTDANIEFTGTYPADVEKKGLVGAQGRALVDLVSKLPDGDLHLSLDEGANNLLLAQGKKRYKLPVSSSDWFQPFSEFPGEGAVPWAGDFLQDILEKVSFCIDDDDSQEAISCLYFKPCGNGRIDACGLNGHQFAVISFINDAICQILPEKGLLIQKKYLPDIKKWLRPDDIELNITDKRVYLRRTDGMEMLSFPRAHFEYPDYNVFMSKLDKPDLSALNLSRQDGVDSMGRILVFNTESQRCVYLDLSEKEVTLSAEGTDGSASESLDVDYSGSITRIAFPTKNLLEIFGHFSSDYLDMRFTAVEGPCGITGPEDVDYTVIIMPMKVSDTSYYSEDEDD